MALADQWGEEQRHVTGGIRPQRNDTHGSFGLLSAQDRKENPKRYPPGVT